MHTPPVTSSLPIPAIVPRVNALVAWALRAGIPMGPNVLMTVRGRRSGVPRTVPVAVLEVEGRRFVFSPFGEVAWVHNLRAAGEAELRHGRRRETVAAEELSPETAAPFLEAGMRDVMRVPRIGTMIAAWYGLGRESTSADALEAARRHPGFELSASRAHP
jgi:deazaflavin-dependent oxidoreductase (nitroreductase family)